MSSGATRPLSFAIEGKTWIAMLRGLQGDGHPALWHLLLRAAYGITGRPEVLPVLAFAIAAAAAWLIVWRSPFPRAPIGLILATHFFICEFSVMARNYGIGMPRTRRYSGRTPVSARELERDRDDHGGRKSYDVYLLK